MAVLALAVIVFKIKFNDVATKLDIGVNNE